MMDTPQFLVIMLQVEQQVQILVRVVVVLVPAAPPVVLVVLE